MRNAGCTKGQVFFKPTHPHIQVYGQSGDSALDSRRKEAAAQLSCDGNKLRKRRMLAMQEEGCQLLCATSFQHESWESEPRIHLNKIKCRGVLKQKKQMLQKIFVNSIAVISSPARLLWSPRGKTQNSSSRDSTVIQWMSPRISWMTPRF
jgi:hypothetical protein